MLTSDEESLSINLLIVKRLRLTLLFTIESSKQGSGGKMVGMRDVCVFSKIEEIGVVADLEFGLAPVVGSEHAREDEKVTDTVDASRADGASEETRMACRAVLREDVGLGDSLDDVLDCCSTCRIQDQYSPWCECSTRADHRRSRGDIPRLR